MKKLFLSAILSVLFYTMLLAKFNVFVELNRFKDAKGNTRFEITYQIPYSNLSFQRVKNGHMAFVKTDLTLIKNGKDVYHKPLQRKILESRNVTNRSDLSYQDKLHFALSKTGFSINLKFKDAVKKDSLKWNKKLVNLTQDDFLSDLELDHTVEIDTTFYRKEFYRGNKIYIGNQNHLFNKAIQDTVYIYYEIYPSSKNEKFDMELVIKESDKVVDKVIHHNINATSNINSMIEKLNIGNYAHGYYSITLSLTNTATGKSNERESFFIVKENYDQKQLVFFNMKDDLKLVRYFLNSRQKRLLKGLSDDSSKSNFISKFWRSHDPNPATEENEFLDLVQDRIKYANSHFSSFSKGWKSDRGRVYIKYGKADFIKKYRTNSSDKYPLKNYVVWQYRSNAEQTYIFFDMQANSTYRLIYSGNDSSENSYPNWEKFVGEDFEMNDLE